MANDDEPGKKPIGSRRPLQLAVARRAPPPALRTASRPDEVQWDRPASTTPKLPAANAKVGDLFPNVVAPDEAATTVLSVAELADEVGAGSANAPRGRSTTELGVEDLVEEFPAQSVPIQDAAANELSASTFNRGPHMFPAHFDGPLPSPVKAARQPQRAAAVEPAVVAAAAVAAPAARNPWQLVSAALGGALIMAVVALVFARVGGGRNNDDGKPAASAVTEKPTSSPVAPAPSVAPPRTASPPRSIPPEVAKASPSAASASPPSPPPQPPSKDASAAARPPSPAPAPKPASTPQPSPPRPKAKSHPVMTDAPF